MAGLEEWDWRAAFADLEVTFAAARYGEQFPVGGAEAVASAVRHLRLDRLLVILATRAEPVLFTAPHLEVDGEAPVDQPAWVVLVAGSRRKGAALPGSDPLASLPGDATVVQAVVSARSGAVWVMVAVPVALDRPH